MSPDPVSRLSPGAWLQQLGFKALRARSLVYNSCLEDPAVDRQALRIGAGDELLVITSAGCNVLDYALCQPRRIHAVDANPRQNALLELKLAGIRSLGHDEFFALFGRGRHPYFQALYRDRLRPQLSPFARRFWDRRGHWFAQGNARDTFYHYGLAGWVARGFRGWLRMRPELGEALDALLDAPGLEAQQRIYEHHIASRLWSRRMNWWLSRQSLMGMLGVPRSQQEALGRQHPGGMAGFIRASVEHVLCRIPLQENYFWQLYLRGAYSSRSCPEYLREANFLALKDGLVERIVPHTGTVRGFLKGHQEQISRFVLLEHMEGASAGGEAALGKAWQQIMQHASPGARLVVRSAHDTPQYLERLQLPEHGPLLERLEFERELAARLQAQDRVHTHAGFHIAEVRDPL